MGPAMGPDGETMKFRSLSDLNEDEYLEWLIPLLETLQENYDRTGRRRRSYHGIGDDDLRKLLEAGVLSADQHETEMLRREEKGVP